MRHAFTLAEIVVALALVSLLFGPISMLMTRGGQETRASRDELLQALLLGELSEQAALLEHGALPAEDGTIDLAAPGVHRIGARGFLHLSPLPEGFTARTLAIEAAGRGCRLRMRIEYVRPGGAPHPVELVAFRYPAAAGVSR